MRIGAEMISSSCVGLRSRHGPSTARATRSQEANAKEKASLASVGMTGGLGLWLSGSMVGFERKNRTLKN